MRISQELYTDLMALIEARAQERWAHDSSDGGLSESIRVMELEKEFKRKHVEGYEDDDGA